jgi:succinoglycan biosynthesis protein ExoM
LSARVARTAPRVAVAVATYRRPAMLEQLLVSLRALRTSEPFDVVVVDNDPDGTTAAQEDALAQALGRPLRVLHEPEPGISAARNAALDALTDHDLVAFIDDDERADPAWLGTLLDRHEATGCAAVTGPVEYDFAGTPPRWALLGGFYMEPGFSDGDHVPMAGTNNLLLDLHVLRRLGLRFDPAFGLIGGSDIVLTRAITDAGGRIEWAQDAVVRETVPAERCRRRWLLRRAVRTGNSYALMHLGRVRHASTLRRAVVRIGLACSGTARIVTGTARLALRPRIDERPESAAALRTVLRGVGVLGAVVGGRVAEYARPQETGRG